MLIYDALVKRYRHISRFRPRLLSTMQFDALPAGKPVLRAYQYLQRIEGRRKESLADAPLQVVTNAWRPYALTTNQRVDRVGYTYCVLDRLVTVIRRRELFVAHPACATPTHGWGCSTARSGRRPARRSAAH